jgi:transcriptional regulator with XRE-family HTH domain
MIAAVRDRNIREIAKRKGLRLGELARAIGLHPTSFSKALAGQHELRPHTRARLIEALGASFDDIFEVRDRV